MTGGQAGEPGEAGEPGQGAQAALPAVDPRPQGEPRRAPEPDDDDDDVYRVQLDVFDGPLDLLLHLVRKHELDIFDIPVSFITSKYLEYLNVMRSIQIDVASEYLVMAATLTHIKSRMLLPPDPNASDDDDAEGEFIDPRTELVRRLLEYQKYKHAAAQLGSRPILDRDIFPRGGSEPVDDTPAPLAPVSVFKLFDAFDQVLKRADQTADHAVLFERVGISERIIELTEMLHDRRRMRFSDLFLQGRDGRTMKVSRGELVITFLALLEMCKMRVVRVLQEDSLAELTIEFSAKRLDGDSVPTAERAAEAEAEEPIEAGHGTDSAADLSSDEDEGDSAAAGDRQDESDETQ